MSDAPPPPSLKHIKKYLDEAKARERQDPMISYHLRLYALQEAMEVRSKIPKEDMSFILGLMDSAEAEKKQLGALGDQADADKQAHVENFALELFEKADDLDRKGQSTLATAKIFNSSYHVMEACKQFGELPDDMAEKIKYAKWRVVEIAKATKERREPAPPRGLEGGAGGDGGDADGRQGGGADAPTSYPPPPPPAEAGGPSSGFEPPPPMPDYMGLPPPPGVVPPAPTDAHQASFDSSVLPGAPAFPPAYPGPPGAPPAYPGAPGPAPGAPPGWPGYAPQMPPPLTSYTPGKPQIMEAHKLCQSGMAALEFQDHITAVHSLRQALQLLTMPPAADVAPE